MEITYPQYRKYHNGKNYFRIISPGEMEEIHFIGDKCFVQLLQAKILPDRNLIHDLTFDYEKMGARITEEEYFGVKERCRG